MNGRAGTGLPFLLDNPVYSHICDPLLFTPCQIGMILLLVFLLWQFFRRTLTSIVLLLSPALADDA